MLAPPKSVFKVFSLIACLLYSGGVLYAQSPDVVKETPPIQDNSFFWWKRPTNQERAVVQHVSTFTRLWNGGENWSSPSPRSGPDFAIRATSSVHPGGHE